MRSEGFQAMAKEYDEIFSHSAIGALQRDSVWSYLDHWINMQHLHVLDIGCGTGEDTVRFLKKGAGRVSGFDPSENMLARALQKTTFSGPDQDLILWEDTVQSWLVKKPEVSGFDLIFSNFGALNLLPPQDLHHLASYLDQHLSPGTDVIFVIMPTLCLWESVYFLYKRQWSKAFRRKSSPVNARIGGAQLKTWYHSPAQIAKIFSGFNWIRTKGIGISIPPSYLATRFVDRLRWLQWLHHLENYLSKAQGTASISDHFLIHLKK